ncbi:rRNA biogenesis protein RRP36 [Beauveria bassiana]|nr:rRNA biogenesis protein RRP36 [Beauveria bassiana]
MPPKRKAQSLGLDRRVRVRRDENWQLEPESDSQQSDNDISEEDVREQESEDEKTSDAEDDGESEVDISSVSFGALARAQASMPSTSRRDKKNRKDTDSDAAKSTQPAKPTSLREQAEARHSVHKDKPPSRTSKHAPQEQTSKKPVSRRREILADPRRRARDPRFDPAVGSVDEEKTRRAYAFLDEYREREMGDLRAAIKKCKDPAEKEAMKRQLLSMESKKKAQKKKDEAEGLLREHREKEKTLVAQGKQPFYLKRSEQKKQLLTNRFADMSKGQVDRAIERKRKKVAGKERKELDSLVRVRGGR